VVTLRPEPNVDALRALRAGLKNLLRSHGLRCVGIATNNALELKPAAEDDVATENFEISAWGSYSGHIIGDDEQILLRRSFEIAMVCGCDLSFKWIDM
jgi:hypothetical protein